MFQCTNFNVSLHSHGWPFKKSSLIVSVVTLHILWHLIVLSFRLIRSVWCWQQEADTTLRKARALNTQRREEYQKAHSSKSRSPEEQPNAGNKQMEKKRKLQEEALQKVSRRYIYIYKKRSYLVWAISRSLNCFVFDVLDRLRRPKTSTGTVWLMLASEKWIWPMRRERSSRRSERWSSSVTSHSKL